LKNSKQLEHIKSLEENKYGANNQILDKPKSLHKNKWGVKKKIGIVLMEKNSVWNKTEIKPSTRVFTKTNMG